METQIAAHLKTIDELRAKITIYEKNLTELKAALARGKR
jgi:uncharacterized coiled-coil protein SlyX